MRAFSILAVLVVMAASAVIGWVAYHETWEARFVLAGFFVPFLIIALLAAVEPLPEGDQ